MVGVEISRETCPKAVAMVQGRGEEPETMVVRGSKKKWEI
jgi:hypothetical protein